MASISTNDVDIGIKKGSTWGTAADVSSGGIKLRASNITLNGNFAELLTRDNGFNKKYTESRRGVFTGTVSMTFDLTFGQGWQALLGAFMGTESTPSETTVSQGDYSRNFDLADDITGMYYTLAWEVEDDDSIELPSVKIDSVAVAQDTNTQGTVTITGTYDRIVTASPTNTSAKLSALSQANYELAVLGNTNHYLRLNTQGGGSLSGTNDIQILGYSFSLKRPLTPFNVLRGANSKYTVEPEDIGFIDGQLMLKIGKIDDGVIDWIEVFNSQTEHKAEILIDGAQIGSGVNTSFKFQFPRLTPMPTVPTGYDLPSNNVFMSPSISYRMLKATSAPTGMTGVTDYLRIVSIDRRSTKWTA